MLIDLIADGAIINATIGGKVGQVTYDLRPTTLYPYHDLRVMVRGEADVSYGRLAPREVERLIRDLDIRVAC